MLKPLEKRMSISIPKYLEESKELCYYNYGVLLYWINPQLRWETGKSSFLNIMKLNRTLLCIGKIGGITRRRQ